MKQMDYRTYTNEDFRENYLRGRIFEQEADEKENTLMAEDLI